MPDKSPTVAGTFVGTLIELISAEDARSMLEPLTVSDDSAPDVERTRAFALVELAVTRWLGDRLREAAPSSDLLGPSAEKLGEFENITSEDEAREAGHFALGVARLARLAGVENFRYVALSAAFAGLAAGEEEWPKVGYEAATALFFQTTVSDLSLEAENALRKMGALVEEDSV
jgi:hypothetical protein